MKTFFILSDYDVILYKKIYLAYPVQPLSYSESTKTLIIKCKIMFFNIGFTISVGIKDGVFSLSLFDPAEQFFENVLVKNSIKLCNVQDLIWLEGEENNDRYKIDEVVYITFLPNTEFLFGITKKGYLISFRKKRNVLCLV